MADRLAEALASWSAEGTAEATARVYRSLLDAVVLLPVHAAAVETQVAERTGLTAEREAELSLLTVTLADGRRVLPVFTSPEDLRRWRIEARPVQAPAREACRAAMDEGWAGLVVDPATHGFVLDSRVVAALADGFLPIAGDEGVTVGEVRRSDLPVGEVEAAPQLVALLRRAVAREPAVAAAWLLAAEPVVVGLQLKVPLDQASVATIAGRLGRRLDPSGGVPLSVAVLEAATVREAAQHAVRLWP